MSSIHELLDDAALRWPNRTAVRDQHGIHTYASLAAASREIGAGLAATGIRPGDRVLLRLFGGRDFAAALYGVLRAGAVAVPVHPATGSFHFRWMLDDAEPVAVVTEPATAGAGTDFGTVSTTDVEALRASGTGADAPDAPSEPIHDDAPALLMYTSGSTGMPRAVVCPHARVRFVVAAIAARLGYTCGDVVLSRIPVSFDYGLYQMFLCAAAGAELVLRPDLAEPAVLREARAVGATVLPIVPSLAAILLRLACREPGPTDVRMLTNTGAALGPPTAAELRRVFPGARIVPMYGMTECKRITIADADDEIRYPGTVGRALDGTEVLAVDEFGRPVAPGIVGELWVRGPHVMAGYWRAPDATRTRFGPGPGGSATLRTGDYGYLDDGGRVYFVGRRDDIFKRRGVRMNTHEIEAAALDVPGVRAAAVLPPAEDGRLTVYVAGDLTPADVIAALARRIEIAKVPDQCVVLPALPTNPNGKVAKDALRSVPFEGGR